VGTKPSLWAHWFAGGWVEIRGASSFFCRGIMDSTLEAAGLIALTLDFPPLETIAADTAVLLWPGCDGRMESCLANSEGNLEGKFNNYANFHGAPHIPIGNIAFEPIQQSGGARGKK